MSHREFHFLGSSTLASFSSFGRDFQSRLECATSFSFSVLDDRSDVSNSDWRKKFLDLAVKIGLAGDDPKIGNGGSYFLHFKRHDISILGDFQFQRRNLFLNSCNHYISKGDSFLCIDSNLDETVSITN